MNIILCGKMGSGKSTVADILKKDYGYKDVAIGDMIKIVSHSFQRAILRGATNQYINQLSTSILGYSCPGFITDANIVANIVKEIGPTQNKTELRPVYQKLGTDVIRKYTPDLWVALAYQKAARLARNGVKVIVSDARFDDEFKFFVNKGFHPFDVVAPLSKRINWLTKRDGSFDAEALNHVSESFNFDCPVIYNDGSIENLKDSIHALLREAAYV